MIEFIRRKHTPAITLPFYPRASGINRFKHAGEVEDMPGIDAVEICTVEQGICQIEQQGRLVTLHAGDSLYKLPGEHRKKVILSENGAVIYWAPFDGAGAAGFMQSYGYPPGALPTGQCQSELYEEIARNLIIGSNEALRKSTALYVELIVRLTGSETATGSSIFPECLRLIQSNFSDPAFNIDALAAELALHRTTLQRLFRKELNTTPLSYLTQCRIQHALDLLRTTRLPVAEIASRSGFLQSNYFCRVIRHHCGKTPEQYRGSFKIPGG